MTPLPPVMSSRIANLLEQKILLFSLVAACGSPVFLVIPEEFEHNLSLFQQVFQDVSVDGRVLFAYKVNKTQAFLATAARRQIGVDVSSLAELRLALAHGITGKDIGVSGPLKDPGLLLLAMQHRCTVVIDALDELTMLASLHRGLSLEQPVDILIRLSGFEVTTQGRNEPAPPGAENGRFGIAVSALPNLYTMLGDLEIGQSVSLRGFAFHIDNHSVRDRGEAIGILVDQVLYARSLGHACDQINIGGGFSVQYVRRDDWLRFLDSYAAALSKHEKTVMFRDKSFGLVVREGRRINRGNFYPYELDVHKDIFLRQLFDYRPQGAHESVSGLLRRYEIAMVIEPGKALVDQSGITLGMVKGLKQSTHGDPLLLCEMNISHLFEQMIGSEFAVDPILLTNPCTGTDDPVDFSCHIAGNLCLESDMVAWRRVPFCHIPRRGDLLAFVNTAGYQMDFVETRMHQMPLPHRIIMYQRDNNWQWKLDEQFSALDLLDRDVAGVDA